MTSDDTTSVRTMLSDPRLDLVVSMSALGIVGSAYVSSVLPSVAGGLNVSDARVGLVMTVFFLPAIVSVPAVGVLADVYGRRAVTLGSLLLFGVAGSLIVVAPTFELLLLLRTIQGIGFAGLTPLSITLLGDLYSGADASTAQGIRVSGNSVSHFVLPIVGGLLAGIAWQAPFLLNVLAFPFFVLAYRYLPETRRTERANDHIGDELRTYWQSIRLELTDWNLGVLFLCALSMWFVKHAVLTFVPIFAVRVLGATFAVAASMLSIRGLVRFLVAPTAGRLVGVSTPKWLLVAAAATIGLGTALVPFVPGIPSLGLAMVVYSAGEGLLSATLNDAVATMASDDHRGGVVSGLNSVKNVANASSPAFFGGVLALAGFDVLFLLAAAVAVGYVVLASVFLAVPRASR